MNPSQNTLGLALAIAFMAFAASAASPPAEPRPLRQGHGDFRIQRAIPRPVRGGRQNPGGRFARGPQPGLVRARRHASPRRGVDARMDQRGHGRGDRLLRSHRLVRGGVLEGLRSHGGRSDRAGGHGQIPDGARPTAHPAGAPGRHAPVDAAFPEFLRRRESGRGGGAGLCERVAGGLLREVSQARPGSAGILAGASPTERKYAGKDASAPADDIVESPGLAAQLRAGQLGFDKLLVVRRRELNPSHVYTYHVEGFGAGGGLYLAVGAQARRAEGTGRLARGPDPRLRPVVRRPRDPVQLAAQAGRGLPGLRHQRRRHEPAPAHRRPAPQLQRLLAARRRHRLPVHARRRGSPTAGFRRWACCIAWSATARDVTRLSANIVNDFTPSVLRRRPHDLLALGIRGQARHPDPEPLDDPPRRHRPGRVLRQPRAQPGHVHGGALDPRARGKVLCLLTSHNGPCRGAIGIVDIQPAATTRQASHPRT